MGAGKHGGFGKTIGSKKMLSFNSGYGSSVGGSPSSNSKVSFPKNKSQLKHIFGNRTGHLTDTPYHRRLLKDLANNKAHFKGVDANGNSWYVRITKDGGQLWVQHRNGIIQNGGKNEKPIKWNNKTGLNKPIKNTMKKKGGK